MEILTFRLRSKQELLGIVQPTLLVTGIAEPVLFSSVSLTGSVDERYHGFSDSYSEGELKLNFHCENAHTLLAGQYYRYGIDAEVFFEVVYIQPDNSELLDYTGRIDFETVVIEAGQVSASVIAGGIAEKLKNRWETPVAMDVKLTLDNLAITPPTQAALFLPGQTIREKGEFSKQGRFFDTSNFGSAGLGGVFYHLPNMIPDPAKPNPVLPTGVVALSTLKGVATLGGGTFALNVISPTPLIAQDSSRGSYAIEIDWLVNINVVLTKASLSIGKAKFAILKFSPVLIVTQPGGTKQQIAIGPVIDSGGYVNSVEEAVKSSYRGSLELAPGATVQLLVLVPCLTLQPVKSIDIETTTINLRIAIERKTRAGSSETNTYLMPDAIRQTLGVTTSTLTDSAPTGRVVGSLIELPGPINPLPGPATEYALTSGALLRGLPKAPSFTPKQLMETLRAHHAAGILIERDGQNREQIRIESGDWFYRGGEILKLDTVLEYKEEPDESLLYNKITVGYEKYPDSGPGVAEEFNTEHTYQTPLVSREAELELKSPLIGAGTAIEEARRLGLSKLATNGVSQPTTADAGPYDDDGFMLHVKSEQGQTDTVRFQVNQPTPRRPYVNKIVTFSAGLLSFLLRGIDLKPGDVLLFSGTGTPNDGKSMRIVGRETGGGVIGGVRSSYEVAPDTQMTTAGPVSAQWNTARTGITLRTNERLDVTGVVDPDTTYNLELSPARMLRRHAGFINSGLIQKKAVEELRCVAYKHNGAMQSQLKPGLAPLPGDFDRQLIRETGNIALGSFEWGQKYFHPEIVLAKVLMSRAERRILFAALKNRGEDSKRLGYISILNPDGNYTEGFVRKIVYNDDSEVAELTLRKRRIVPVGGPECADYHSWSFGRFENDPTADVSLYRFCRFSDFA